MKRFFLILCVVALSLMSFGLLSGCPGGDSGTDLEDRQPGDVVPNDGGADTGGSDTDDSGDDAEDADDSEDGDSVEELLEDD